MAGIYDKYASFIKKFEIDWVNPVKIFKYLRWSPKFGQVVKSGFCS